ncbi:xanthine dehydrogenase family protein molybdopterin-binding subunit [Chitinasiproducens palmae]|uniref:Xanthine dehydrogenase, molybdenum binding subunit apoprotein n=1 Tax=Chitinasiproducens palmae TaxID=1770053 RepID=A0A1H2PWH2_9BURK|nr:xanthine dehydrogenase family protein molybdopterin-binding subunit [Chitinasiproducens palmae]SDV51381.1 xanthine dehydrogenase, molybdenum binding subunit apoprotein [Chitinasiproducens palmae]
MKNPDKNISAVIGGAYSRVDGPLKVSGAAHYSSDRRLPGMLTAVPVSATIAKGTLIRLDTQAAEHMPGVRAVITRRNIGPLYRVNKASKVKIDESRPPLEDDVIRYYGQYVALVVADTFEQASAAAAAVHAEYRSERPNVSMKLSPQEKPEEDSKRGDVDAAFAAGPVTLDATYTTPIETHNPIELHASVAAYDGSAFTLYECTQAIVNHRSAMAQMLGVPDERVRIITEYLGGGFGGKLWPWTHSVLAAAAARQLKRPIKLVVSRKMMFETVGHRPNTQQRMRLSATREGRLTSLQQDYITHAPVQDKRKENCGEATPYLYSTPNLRVTSAYARRDIAPDTSMRGPGAVPGLFAVESAMDEMALALGMDPVAFRLLNEPKIDESLGVPFSSRHLAECLRAGADKFGWARRDPRVGAMRDGEEVLGWGVASCSWMAKRIPAQANVQFNADGTLRVSSATQDIGTGTYTVLAQMAARDTGVPLDRVVVDIGDSQLPSGPMSGGSMATSSLVPAVSQAAKQALARLLEAASQAERSSLSGASVQDLTVTAGRVHRKGSDPASGLPFEKVLQTARLSHVGGSGKSGDSSSDPGADKVSIHSYGAHFVEIGWQPAIARLRVRRVVTFIDGGKVINTKTGRNQIEGAIMMGIGMAMFEKTSYDARTGAPINSNLADYIVAVNADTPDIDVTFLDYPDYALNELGARGIGEIGLAGFAAAVTAAVHHATGIRVRDLPVHIEDLLASTVRA